MTELQILRAAVCVASVDGRISPEEGRLLDRFAERAGVGSASLKAMIDQGLNDRDFYDDQLDLIRNETDEVMRDLFQMAMADGAVTDDESSLLQRFAQKIGLTDERFARYLDEAKRRTPGG